MHYVIRDTNLVEFVRKYWRPGPCNEKDYAPCDLQDVYEVHFTTPAVVELIGEPPHVQAFAIDQNARHHWLGQADDEMRRRGVYGWLAYRFPGITFYGPADMDDFKNGCTQCLVDASGVYVARQTTRSTVPRAAFPGAEVLPTDEEPLTSFATPIPNQAGTFQLEVGGELITIAANKSTATDEVPF